MPLPNTVPKHIISFFKSSTSLLLQPQFLPDLAIRLLVVLGDEQLSSLQTFSSQSTASSTIYGWAKHFYNAFLQPSQHEKKDAKKC
jgi:hypothetical protein